MFEFSPDFTVPFPELHKPEHYCKDTSLSNVLFPLHSLCVYLHCVLPFSLNSPARQPALHWASPGKTRESTLPLTGDFVFLSPLLSLQGNIVCSVHLLPSCPRSYVQVTASALFISKRPQSSFLWEKSFFLRMSSSSGSHLGCFLMAPKRNAIFHQRPHYDNSFLPQFLQSQLLKYASVLEEVTLSLEWILSSYI